MNCNSFFPGYYNSTRGPNSDFNGRSWPDKISVSGYNCSNAFSFSYPDQHHLVHYMEALKSTMLKQEAVFKDQIHELHRVYSRQKELMMEMKGAGLNPVLYENSYKNVPRTVNNTSFRWMNPCARSYIKRSETNETSDERSKEVGLDLNIGNKRYCKVVDLELPAHEFINVEEKETLDEGKVCEVFPGKIFGVQITSEKRSSLECLVRNPDHHLAYDCDSLKTKGLLDLNKPIKIEEEEYSESNDSAAPATGVQIPSSKTVDESQQILHSEAEKAQAVLFSDDDEAGTGIDLNSSPEDSCNVRSLLNKRQDSFSVTQALPCLNGLASSRKRSNSSNKTSCSAKRSRLCFVPVSPENKESARPSVESDNNQSSLGKENSDSSRDVESVQTKVILEKKEPCNLSAEDDEQKRTAADIIVDISSSCSRSLSENFAVELKQPSFSVNLDWFATIALSVNEDSKPEFGSSLCEHQEHSFSDEMDYFEAMTLQLTETQEEEHFKKTEIGDIEVIGSNLVDGSVRKGPSRRAKKHHKNFQNDFLTSLACLSRKEVTTDLQMIGGLMEATGMKQESVSTRKRKKKNVILSKKKRSFGSTETVLSSTDKIDLRTDVGWGKITRRPRGPRSAAVNFKVNLGQVE